MNNFAITQHLPVSDHVYKYLLKIVGSDSYEVTRDDYIGKIVLSTLTKIPGDLRATKKTFSKIFNVKLQENHYTRNGMHISSKSAQLFNQTIDAKMREEMFIHIVLVKKYKEELYLQEIRNYLESFDITEDDLKLDTIYREFKRKKDKFETIIN